MNKKNISPKLQQPVDRVRSGQLPTALASLSEEAIGSQALALPAKHLSPPFSGTWEDLGIMYCSYDGDDE